MAGDAQAAPGQAAYEAWHKARYPSARPEIAPGAWSLFDDEARSWWDAAAEAVAAPLREQLATTQAIARAMQATAIEILGRFRQSGPAYTATASASPEQLARWRAVLGGDEAMTGAADLRGQLAQAQAERDACKLRADHYEGLWRAEHGLPPDGPRAAWEGAPGGGGEGGHG